MIKKSLISLMYEAGIYSALERPYPSLDRLYGA